MRHFNPATKKFRWPSSAAKALLKKDIAEKKNANKKPRAFRMTRPEYRQHDLATFRNQVYKTGKRAKFDFWLQQNHNDRVMKFEKSREKLVSDINQEKLKKLFAPKPKKTKKKPESKTKQVVDQSNSNGDSVKNVGTFVDIPAAQLEKMRVKDIEQELKKRGLPASGKNKADKLAKLKHALMQRIPNLK